MVHWDSVGDKELDLHEAYPGSNSSTDKSDPYPRASSNFQNTAEFVL